MRMRLLYALAPLALVVRALMQAPAPAPSRLAEFTPPGALVYLEARDFASLLREWNMSDVKRLWLESDNFQVFSRSRLFLRLTDAHAEFAAAAGVPAAMDLAEAVAGDQSAIAVYDIGKLEFLYITRLPSARAMENAPWRTRSTFEPRNIRGQAYYVRTEASSRRTVAFAATSDYLLLATREDLISGALALLGGQSGASVRQEGWYDAATKAAGPAGELRLVLNLDALVRAPHFRSYWIQRNLSDIRQYSAAASDIRRSAGEIREDRVLLRREGPTQPPDFGAAIAEVVRLAPDQAGFYRAWSRPDAAAILDLLERKVLAPHLSAAPASKFAPVVATGERITGSEADLETRIDEPPLENTGGRFVPAALAKLIADARPDAMLQVEGTRAAPGNVFVRTESVIALHAPGDWSADAARAAVLDAIRSLYTTSQLGLGWTQRQAGRHTVQEIDGLVRLAMFVQGRVLVVSDSAELLASVLDRLSRPVGTERAQYIAALRHARESANFAKLMRLIEHREAHPPVMAMRPPAEGEAEPQLVEAQAPEAPREPEFFSGNLASLSRALSRVESAGISVRDNGPSVSQTVIYRLSR